LKCNWELKKLPLPSDYEAKMKIEKAKVALLLLSAVLCAASAWAQSIAASELRKATDTNAIRVIRDPHTALRWRLERDPARSGAPGRMVLLSDQERSQPESVNIVNGVVDRVMKPNRNSPYPVIRSGDRLILEEDSAVAEVRLEAVALGSAVEGEEFRARVVIGGKILRAVAIAPGRAAFAATEGRP
jgi:hypothetical protein